MKKINIGINKDVKEVYKNFKDSQEQILKMTQKKMGIGFDTDDYKKFENLYKQINGTISSTSNKVKALQKEITKTTREIATLSNQDVGKGKQKQALDSQIKELVGQKKIFEERKGIHYKSLTSMREDRKQVMDQSRSLFGLKGTRNNANKAIQNHVTAQIDAALKGGSKAVDRPNKDLSKGIADGVNKSVDAGLTASKKKTAIAALIAAEEEAEREAERRRKGKKKAESFWSAVFGSVLRTYSDKRTGFGGMVGGVGRMKGLGAKGSKMSWGAAIGGMAASVVLSQVVQAMDLFTKVEKRAGSLRMRGAAPGTAMGEGRGILGAGRAGTVSAEEMLGLSENFMRSGGALQDGRAEQLAKFSRGFGMAPVRVGAAFGAMAGLQGQDARGETRLPETLADLFSKGLERADLPMFLSNLQGVLETLAGILPNISESTQTSVANFQKALIENQVSTKAASAIMTKAIADILNPRKGVKNLTALMSTGMFKGEGAMLDNLDRLTKLYETSGGQAGINPELGVERDEDGNIIREGFISKVTKLIQNSKGNMIELEKIARLIIEASPVDALKGSAQIIKGLFKDAIGEATLANLVGGSGSMSTDLKIFEALTSGLNKVVEEVIERNTPDEEDTSEIEKVFKEYSKTPQALIQAAEALKESAHLAIGKGAFGTMNALVNTSKELKDKFIELKEVITALIDKTPLRWLKKKEPTKEETQLRSRAEGFSDSVTSLSKDQHVQLNSRRANPSITDKPLDEKLLSAAEKAFKDARALAMSDGNMTEKERININRLQAELQRQAILQSEAILKRGRPKVEDTPPKKEEKEPKKGDTTVTINVDVKAGENPEETGKIIGATAANILKQQEGDFYDS